MREYDCTRIYQTDLIYLLIYMYIVINDLVLSLNQSILIPSRMNVQRFQRIIIIIFFTIKSNDIPPRISIKILHLRENEMEEESSRDSIIELLNKFPWESFFPEIPKIQRIVSKGGLKYIDREIAKSKS